MSTVSSKHSTLKPVLDCPQQCAVSACFKKRVTSTPIAPLRGVLLVYYDPRSSLLIPFFFRCRRFPFSNTPTWSPTITKISTYVKSYAHQKTRRSDTTHSIYIHRFFRHRWSFRQTSLVESGIFFFFGNSICEAFLPLFSFVVPYILGVILFYDPFQSNLLYPCRINRVKRNPGRDKTWRITGLIGQTNVSRPIGVLLIRHSVR